MVTRQSGDWQTSLLASCIISTVIILPLGNVVLCGFSECEVIRYSFSLVQQLMMMGFRMWYPV